MNTKQIAGIVLIVIGALITQWGISNVLEVSEINSAIDEWAEASNTWFGRKVNYEEDKQSYLGSVVILLIGVALVVSGILSVANFKIKTK